MTAPAQAPASHLTTAEATLLVMAARGEVQFGTVYRGSRGKGWVIAVHIDGRRERIYALAGAGFRKREIAEGVLAMIRVAIAQGKSPAEAVSPYLSRKSPLNLVTRRYEGWVEHQEARAEIGDLSPGTVREYRRYARERGEIGFWRGFSIYEVTTGQLEAWNIWLARRGLAPSTRRHVLGALRTCLGWVRRMGALRELPEWPSIEVPEYSPQIITPRAQDAILATFAERVEWLSHALAARCGLRSGEVRAVSPGDYHPPDDEGIARLTVRTAMKTLSWRGLPGPTKNRRHRTIPIPEDVAGVVEAVWPAGERLGAARGAPMVWNPRTGRRWSHWALRESWLGGCRAAGLPPVPLYEGTKHSAATDMLARTKDPRAVGEYLGHRDPRSTERYAKVGDRAMVDIARRRGE